jgi:hypothetical protein
MGGFLPWRLQCQTIIKLPSLALISEINDLTAYIGKLAFVGQPIAKIERIRWAIC